MATGVDMDGAGSGQPGFVQVFRPRLTPSPSHPILRSVRPLPAHVWNVPTAVDRSGARGSWRPSARSEALRPRVFRSFDQWRSRGPCDSASRSRRLFVLEPAPLPLPCDTPLGSQFHSGDRSVAGPHGPRVRTELPSLTWPWFPFDDFNGRWSQRRNRRSRPTTSSRTEDVLVTTGWVSSTSWSIIALPNRSSAKPISTIFHLLHPVSVGRQNPARGI